MSDNQRFQSIVRRAMAPILNAYGYCVTKSDDNYVRLDSERASIQVAYDGRRSFEVAVTFSELEDGCLLRGIPLNLGEVFREFQVPDASRHCYYQSTELSSVESFLVATCGTLLNHCGSILSGDRQAFAAVNVRRRQEAASYTRQLEIFAVREQADDAWRNQRFKEFIDLLEAYRNSLSDVDQKKLDYASKKVGL